MNRLIRQIIYVADDLGCDYMLIDDVLHFRPHHSSETANENERIGYFSQEDDWYEVEPELVGEEIVQFNGKDMTLDKVYEIVTKELRGE